LDLHKPHAAKTWREFFIELGTIVTGILIALALEQAVEWWRDHRHVVDARANIRAEISAHLGLLARRSQTEACVSRRLDEIAGLIAQASTGKQAQAPIWIGHPAIWPMSNGRYQSALQSGSIGLMPGDEQAGYANLYAAFAEYDATEQDEQKAWAELRTLEQQQATTPVSDWQLRSALEQARTARWQMEATAGAVGVSAKRLNIEPNGFVPFKLQSTCIPLHTPRAEALKRVVEGRPLHQVYDEP
jgi:hypothetical protein